MTYLLSTKYLGWFMWVIRVDVECEFELTTLIHSCLSVTGRRSSHSLPRDLVSRMRVIDIPSSGVRVRLNDKTFVGSGKSIFIVFGSSNSVKSDRQQGSEGAKRRRAAIRATIPGAA
jgi:hypothetical protein